MPKHIQQSIAVIVAALISTAFFVLTSRLYGGSSSVIDAVLLIVACVAGIQLAALHRMEDYVAALLEKLAKIEACKAAVSSASTSVSYAGIESPVESQRERWRREREQILVHGAAETIANHPGQAREVANGIKAFLSELDDGVAPKG